MAKLKFRNYDSTQSYDLGHAGPVDVTVNASMLAKNNFATLEDVHAMLSIYGQNVQYTPKPEVRVESVEFPNKPNVFNTTFASIGITTVNANDKLRKATFEFAFGTTDDDTGNNPHIFKDKKHWMCLEEWRYSPNDKLAMHTRVGYTLEGMKEVNGKQQVDIYFREDPVFAIPGTTRLHVKYRLFMIDVKDIQGNGNSLTKQTNTTYGSHKPIVDLQDAWDKTTCNIDLYYAEEKSFELKDLVDSDTLQYSSINFIFKPGMKANEEDILYSETPFISNGNLPIPNFIELNFDSPRLKQNPYFKGTEEEWKASLIYRIPITPSDFKETSLPNASGKVFYITHVPNFFLTRIYPGSGDVDLNIRYGYSGNEGDIMSPSTPCKYLLKDKQTPFDLAELLRPNTYIPVLPFKIPDGTITDFEVKYGVLQTEYNINKYPAFTANVKPKLAKLTFGDVIENIDKLLVYDKDYPSDLDLIQNEVVKTEMRFFESKTGNETYKVTKNLSLTEVSNALRFNMPILYTYEEAKGIEGDKDYFVSLHVDLTTSPSIMSLLGLEQDQAVMNFDIKKLHTSKNVIEVEVPSFENNGDGLLDDPKNVDNVFTYYGEMEGNEFYKNINYVGDFKKGNQYKLGDEFKVSDRSYGFFKGNVPSVVTDPSKDPNVVMYNSVGDVGKLPTIQQVFKLLGLNNKNILNYGTLPYNCSKADVNYPDMEATVQSDKARWIKVMGPENKLLYISKGSYIDSAYQLAFLRRGLLGSGKTFRFGNDLYKLRLLATEPKSALEYTTQADTQDVSREFEIIDHLLRGNLANYTPIDLGMETTNDNKTWSYTGYPYGIELSNTLPEQTADSEFSKYFEGSPIGKYPPFKQMKFKAKDTVNGYSVRVESTSEFIDATKLNYNEDTKEITVEFYNLPENGMNAWQDVKITLDELNPPDINNRNTHELHLYLATEDVVSNPSDEYELLGQDDVRIFNPSYLGYANRFRQVPHEFFGFKYEDKSYGAFPQIALNVPIVLEQIIPGFEPYNKTITTPGNNALDYNPGLDIGYYGEVEGRDFFKPSELKAYLKLSTLKLEGGDELYYYKCYYHGSIFYIPNRPIGKVRVSELADKGLLFGYDSSLTLQHGDLKFKTMLLNTSECYDHHRGRVATNKLGDLEIGGLFKDLLCRLTDKYDPYVGSVEKFDTHGVKLEISDTDVILTKDIIGDPTVVNNHNVLVGDEIKGVGRDDIVSYFPIIFIEATDYAQDLTYPEGGYSKYRVVKVEKEYEEIYFEKEKITRKRRVDKVRVVKTYQEETKVVKVPNGIFSTPVGKKTTEQEFGLIGFVCSQRDLANVHEPIYSRSMMDIRKQGGELKALYGDFITSFRDILTKPYIVGGLDGRDISFAKPFHIMQFFDTYNLGIEFIQSLTKEGKILRLNNDNYKEPNTVTIDGKKYPNLIAGCISTSRAVMTTSGAYQIEKDQELNTDILLSLNNKGNMDNNWVKVKDSSGKDIQIPYTNPMVTYQQLTDKGKDYAKNLLDYLKQVRYIDKNADIEELCFGFVVVNLNELAYCKYGVVTGTILTPDLYEDLTVEDMQDYFMSNGDSRSDGNDFIDLFKRVEGTTDRVVLEMIPVYKEESYIDFENYETLVDVKKKRVKKVLVDKVIYG